MRSDGLVPAVAVVDTWNLRGQCRDLLGEGRFPTVDGVRRGLAAYGFDIVHVYAAAAVDRPRRLTASLERRMALTDRFAAAVDARPGRWLVLGDAAMVDMCGRADGSTQGAERREMLVRQLRSPDTVRMWRPHHVEDGQQVLRHRTGVEGTWPGRASEPVPLHPVAVDLGRGRQVFPRLRLADRPGAGTSDLVDATVVQWSGPPRVEIAFDGRMRTLEAPPGSVFTGMRVLVDAPRQDRPRLVGAIDGDRRSRVGRIRAGRQSSRCCGRRDRREHWCRRRSLTDRRSRSYRLETPL